MAIATKSDVIDAFRTWWYRAYPFKEFDLQVDGYLNARKLGRGRLRAARRALMISTGEIALRMGITRSAYWKMEARELTGRITIGDLERAAEGLECELLYVLRPKSSTNYSEEVFKRILPDAKKALLKFNPDHPKKIKMRLAAHAIDLLRSFRVRRGAKMNERYRDRESWWL
ncbi:MAG: hypothetical protein ABL958_17830 [Bdellovibrionia bacterium]